METSCKQSLHQESTNKIQNIISLDNYRWKKSGMFYLSCQLLFRQQLAIHKGHITSW